MLKACVIGAGFMGELHCKTYAALKDIEFTGAFDADEHRASEIAAKYSVKSFGSIEELISRVDIASIAVPTVHHYKTAMLCAEKGVHMLIEKPITATLEEADGLVKMIDKTGITAGVGYIERFNPCVIELIKLLKGKIIRSLKAVRLAPPAHRANDVSVVIDLMLHDIDIVLNIVDSDIKGVEANGRKTGSDVLNDVSANLDFGCGVTAEFVSNKVAREKSRTIVVECEDCTVKADLIKRVIVVAAPGKTEKFIEAAGEEPIKAEIIDFIGSVREKTSPRVSAKDSLRSFKLACEIEKTAGLSQ
jgi:virulence factor